MKKLNDNSLALMYSGGLDSYISYHYALNMGFNPIPIYVNFGHDYSEKEIKVLKLNFQPKVEILNLKDLWHLISVRLSNQIIPSRNVLLAVIGSMIAPRVWINALDGEQLGKERDKSLKFFEDSTNLLTYTNNFFQPKTIIESPFLNYSKSEIIKWALEHDLLLENLFSTVSCYDSDKLKCGKCLTCVKRYLAFLENNITEPGYIEDPLKSEYYKELLIEIPLAHKNNDYSRFTEKRILEFLNVSSKKI